MLKQVAVISAVIAFGGLTTIGYGLFAAHVQTFYVGCAITMVALQCGINAHIAMIAQRNNVNVDRVFWQKGGLK